MKFIAVDLAGEGKLNPEIRNMIPENVRLVYCGGSGCIKSKCNRTQKGQCDGYFSRRR